MVSAPLLIFRPPPVSRLEPMLVVVAVWVVWLELDSPHRPCEALWVASALLSWMVSKVTAPPAARLASPPALTLAPLTVMS